MNGPSTRRRVDPAVDIVFDTAHTARAVVVPAWDDLSTALRMLRLGRPGAVVVVVGGADLADRDLGATMSPTFATALVPAMAAVGAIGVDGGTDAGVMRTFGAALARSGEPYTLVGVVAEGTVRLPTEEAATERSPLEPHHTHFVLVPGTSWGDESRWLARTATVLAAGRPSLTVVANGGEVTYDDVGHSVADRRPVIALRGSGRTADDLAAAATGRRASARAVGLAGSDLIRAHDVADPAGLAALVMAVLTGDLGAGAGMTTQEEGAG